MGYLEIYVKHPKRDNKKQSEWEASRGKRNQWVFYRLTMETLERNQSKDGNSSGKKPSEPKNLTICGGGVRGGGGGGGGHHSSETMRTWITHLPLKSRRTGSDHSFMVLSHQSITLYLYLPFPEDLSTAEILLS